MSTQVNHALRHVEPANTARTPRRRQSLQSYRNTQNTQHSDSHQSGLPERGGSRQRVRTPQQKLGWREIVGGRDSEYLSRGGKRRLVGSVLLGSACCFFVAFWSVVWVQRSLGKRMGGVCCMGFEKHGKYVLFKAYWVRPGRVSQCQKTGSQYGRTVRMDA